LIGQYVSFPISPAARRISRKLAQTGASSIASFLAYNWIWLHGNPHGKQSAMDTVIDDAEEKLVCNGHKKLI